MDGFLAFLAVVAYLALIASVFAWLAILPTVGLLHLAGFI